MITTNYIYYYDQLNILVLSFNKSCLLFLHHYLDYIYFSFSTTSFITFVELFFLLYSI